MNMESSYNSVGPDTCTPVSLLYFKMMNNCNSRNQVNVLSMHKVNGIQIKNKLQQKWEIKKSVNQI